MIINLYIVNAHSYDPKEKQLIKPRFLEASTAKREGMDQTDDLSLSVTLLCK